MFKNYYFTYKKNTAVQVCWIEPDVLIHSLMPLNLLETIKNKKFSFNTKSTKNYLKINSYEYNALLLYNHY